MLVPSRDALTAEIDGLLFVLDLRTERYYAFDAVATTMWRLLTELGDRERVLDSLAERYRVDRSVLARDLDALTSRLIEGGFVRRVDGPEPAAAPAAAHAPAAEPRLRRKPSPVRAWWWLARTALRLRRDGFAAAYRRSVELGAYPAALPDAVEDLLPRALRAFGNAENAFILRRAPEDCFPRSVALFCFLRELGVPVEHRIGVNRYPFRAHAYVAWQGRVLSDHPGNRRAYTTIARIPA